MFEAPNDFKLFILAFIDGETGEIIGLKVALVRIIPLWLYSDEMYLIALFYCKKL